MSRPSLGNPIANVGSSALDICPPAAGVGRVVPLAFRASTILSVSPVPHTGQLDIRIDEFDENLLSAADLSLYEFRLAQSQGHSTLRSRSPVALP
jgi:hypothetical protein